MKPSNKPGGFFYFRERVIPIDWLLRQLLFGVIVAYMIAARMSQKKGDDGKALWYMVYAIIFAIWLKG